MVLLVLASGSPNRCGWRYRDKSNLTEWSVLGALGEGTDLIPDKKFYLPTNGGMFTLINQCDQNDGIVMSMMVQEPSQSTSSTERP